MPALSSGFFDAKSSLPRGQAAFLVLGLPVLEDVLYLRLHDVEGHIVEAAVDDDVGEILRRLDVEIVHRLDRRQVLADDVLEVTAALVHIAQHAAQDALIGIGLDEDLDVEEIAQALILEDQDALDDDDLARLDDLRLLRARVARKVVDGTLDALPSRSALRCATSRSVSKESGWS